MNQRSKSMNSPDKPWIPGKPRKDRISDEIKTRVQGFYKSPLVSREMPSKKEVLKKSDDERTLEPRFTMVMSVEEAFGDYRQQFPEDKIQLTSFRKLKPDNVKPFSETSRRTCLCTSCSNVALKLQAVKKFVAGKIFPEISQLTKATLTTKTLCAYETHPNQKYLERTCVECQSNFDTLFAPLKENFNDEITWSHWEYVNIERDGNSKRAICCVEKHTITWLDWGPKAWSSAVPHSSPQCQVATWANVKVSCPPKTWWSPSHNGHRVDIVMKSSLGILTRCKLPYTQWWPTMLKMAEWWNTQW